jgi:spermidine/putrescine transport system permease protein
METAAVKALSRGRQRPRSTADRARRRATLRGIAFASPAVLWLLGLTVVPLGFAVVMSTWSSSIFGLQQTYSLGNFARLLQTPLYAELLFKTFRMALTTTALTLVFAYPVAFFLSFRSGSHKALLVVLVFIPFWTGYVVRTFAWLPILGRTGVINQFLLWLGIADEPVDWFLFNEGAVYVGLVYVYLLFMILPIFLSLDRIDRRLIEAAVDLGARPAAVFRHILLPLSWPGVLSGCIMVFLLAFGAYVTPTMLGGPSGIMFSNTIAAQFTDNNDWAFGAALSLVMMAVVLGILFLTGRSIGVQNVFLGSRHGQ